MPQPESSHLDAARDNSPASAAKQAEKTPPVRVNHPTPRVLPTQESLASSALVEKLLVEQQMNWQKGNGVLVEVLLAGNPELRDDEEGVLDLLFHEVLLREERGERVDLDEYARRFPACHGRLRQQLQLRRVMDDAIDADDKDDLESTILQPSLPAPPAPGDLTLAMKYHSLRFLAEGGLGAVYVGLDQQLNREVAIKFMNAEHTRDEESRRRFLLEAEVTSRLEHPGIVPVHGVGQTADGRPFYAMRFIRGETFDAAIQRFHGRKNQRAPDRGLEWRGLLARFVSVCNTIAYAHNRGILHRDIKPENIMLGRYGETVVVDWGLTLSVGRDERARASGERTLVPRSDSDSSNSGRGGGTPAYISPEQAAVSSEVGPGADIYSLGVTLYKILTGRTPFKGKNARDILRQVEKGKFDPPRHVCPEVPRPLEAACLKAMAYYPQDRYTTALELAADIEHWLGNEPVSVYRERWRERGTRWARRHRGLVGLAGAGLAAVILLSVLSAFWYKHLANRESQAHQTAENARQDNLSASARFAALTVASEIDLRWRVLETEAADPDLRDLLLKAEENPADPDRRKPLQGWLDSRYIEHNKATQASTWSLNLRERGIQVARSPFSDQTVGKPFAYRDYFHGKGGDRDPDDLAGVEPIQAVHRSSVFRSMADDQFRVAFSVPVWTGKLGSVQRKVLAVLNMTVEMGKFSVLQAGLGPNQLAVLVDTKSDWIESDERRGLILHHQCHLDLRQQEPDKCLIPFRLETDTIKLLEKLRTDRLRQEHALDGRGSERSKSRSPSSSYLIQDYQDPTGGNYGGLWRAAFEPVLIKGRPDHIKDTGWVVIVQERLGG